MLFVKIKVTFEILMFEQFGNIRIIYSKCSTVRLGGGLLSFVVSLLVHIV